MAFPGDTGALTAGLAVFSITVAAVAGPAVGLSPWITTLFTGLALAALTADAAYFGGRGGHVEHVCGHERVVHHHISKPQAVQGPDGEQPGIARPCAKDS